MKLQIIDHVFYDYTGPRIIRNMVKKEINLFVCTKSTVLEVFLRLQDSSLYDATKNFLFTYLIFEQCQSVQNLCN